MPNSKNPILSEYVKLLGLSSLLLMILTVGEGVVASIIYGSQAQSIEGIWHRDLSQRWTIGLLWIPLVLQLLVLIFLSRRVWRHKSDQTIRHYFKFYFIRTFISTFAYVTLWLCYVIFTPLESGQKLVWILRPFSLLLIALLIYFVVQATYLITRPSFRNSKRLFTAKDIQEKYDCICDELGSVSPGSKGKENPPISEDPSRSDLRTIHQWLLKDRDYKIHRVAYKGTMADLDIAHLIEALNRLVCNRQFYNFRKSNSEGDDLPLSVFEADNRTFIETTLLERCESAPGTSGNARNNNGLWVRMAMALFGDRRTDKLMGQRDGIALFPFYTMVFFFSLFLCVAYLFGFAFAFEDKSVQTDPLRPSLGLLMNDDLLEDLGKYSAPMPSPSPTFYQLSAHQKFFYFKSGGAGITTFTRPDNNDDRMKRIARINENSLSSLVDLIKKALPTGTLRVLMIGRADDSSVDKTTYASNYEIAAARISSVRYLLQEKLIEERVPPKQLATINWIESPFSNDGSLVPKEKQEPELSKISQVLDNEMHLSKELGARVPKELIARLDEDLSFKYGEKKWCNEFRALLGRLKDEVLKGKVTLQGMREIHGDISRWANHKDNGELEKADRLEDDIDAELYQIEDPSGRKRAVEVYLYDAEPTSQETTKTLNLQQNPKRMALMDYLYFAITRGNSDVKPVTPYTKFLCTLSNLTEFFFIVVFFNTLLTLRRRKSEAI